jgi:hypothetical protein
VSAATCRGCSAPILWIRTASGKAMPVDAEPVRQAGKAVLWNPDGTQAMPDAEFVTVGHQSHFATCVKAHEFRRKGA